MNRTDFISCLCILATALCLPSPSFAGDIDIRIRNRGDTSIHVAVARVGGILDSTQVWGWYTINPSSWLEPVIYTGDSAYTYYLAFAVENQQGDFGYISYFPSNYGSISRANRPYAVKATSFKRVGRDSDLRKAPPGYTLVPFTTEIDTGSYGDHDVAIEVRPSYQSKLDIVLSYSEETRRKMEEQARIRAEQEARQLEIRREKERKIIMKKVCEHYSEIVENSARLRNKGSSLDTLEQEAENMSDEFIDADDVKFLLTLVFQRPYLEANEEGELFFTACEKDLDNIDLYKAHKKTFIDKAIEKLKSIGS